MEKHKSSKSRADIGIEFLVAVVIFLSAFWFIYLQSTVMLTQRIQRQDLRQPAMQLLSSVVIHDAGTPPEWTTGPNEFGLAYYDEKANHNILDETKLDYMAAQDCNDIMPRAFKGLSYSIKVSTPEESWECSSSIQKIALIERPAYVRRTSGEYEEGVIRVWAA
ncbi:MAG: hypothetical protein JW834_04105 [Candidatus Diapherotrites archaeon]|nr:hypothetical protein [Candidatus Diapherotrites archaeon]